MPICRQITLQNADCMPICRQIARRHRGAAQPAAAVEPVPGEPEGEDLLPAELDHRMPISSPTVPKVSPRNSTDRQPEEAASSASCEPVR